MIRRLSSLLLFLFALTLPIVAWWVLQATTPAQAVPHIRDSEDTALRKTIAPTPSPMSSPPYLYVVTTVVPASAFREGAVAPTAIPATASTVSTMTTVVPAPVFREGVAAPTATPTTASTVSILTPQPTPTAMSPFDSLPEGACDWFHRALLSHPELLAAQPEWAIVGDEVYTITLAITLTGGLLATTLQCSPTDLVITSLAFGDVFSVPFAITVTADASARTSTPDWVPSLTITPSFSSESVVWQSGCDVGGSELRCYIHWMDTNHLLPQTLHFQYTRNEQAKFIALSLQSYSGNIVRSVVLRDR
ncbi:MAG: hypothetical protein QXS54_06375 [Candidatus Methanomethylicaceae archaeon]